MKSGEMGVDVGADFKSSNTTLGEGGREGRLSSLCVKTMLRVDFYIFFLGFKAGSVETGAPTSHP